MDSWPAGWMDRRLSVCQAGQTDGRGVKQYPRFFFEKHGDSKALANTTKINLQFRFLIFDYQLLNCNSPRPQGSVDWSAFVSFAICLICYDRFNLTQSNYKYEKPNSDKQYQLQTIP